MRISFEIPSPQDAVTTVRLTVVKYPFASVLVSAILGAGVALLCPASGNTMRLVTQWLAEASAYSWIPVSIACAIASAVFVGRPFGVSRRAELGDPVAMTSSGAGGRYDRDRSRHDLGRSLCPYEWLANMNVFKTDGFDAEACSRALHDSLGPTWKNFGSPPDHIRALIVFFYHHAGGNLPDTLKRQVATAFANLDGKALHEEIIILTEPYFKNGALLRELEVVGKTHVYTSTLLIAMLKKARAEGGVFPTSEFLWLKNIDRPLYYALSNVGRKAYFVEGLAAIARYEAEIESGVSFDRVHENSVEALRRYAVAWKSDKLNDAWTSLG